MSEILEKVAVGEQTFIVYKFGRKKAIINPPFTKTKMKKKKIDFSKLPAYGIWKDRKDMRNSAAWVRKLREKNSRRFYRIP